MKNGIARSPLFYVGDKYKLIREIRSHFPARIRRLVEPFAGGGSVMLNVDADAYLLNDLDSYVVSIHRLLESNAGREPDFLEELFRLIDQYGLSLSLCRDDVPAEMKKAFPKTFFARYNKAGYAKLKDDFVRGGQRDMRRLYLLLVYGFNHMLRFNRKGVFNLPVGNVDFNKNVREALADYFRLALLKSVEWSSGDFRSFLGRIEWREGDFVYLDPPYLITASEYNKYWTEGEERDLLTTLDRLTDRNVPFAISNVTHYRGRENGIFLEWAGRYQSHPIKSNYISFNDNSVKHFNEVLVTNY